jgi:hypothetical protein
MFAIVRPNIQVAISPKVGGNPLDTSSGLVYVNAKQYERILKRRMQRAKWEHQESLSALRQPYINKSRHMHANRRKYVGPVFFLNV